MGNFLLICLDEARVNELTKDISAMKKLVRFVKLMDVAYFCQEYRVPDKGETQR